MYPSLQLSQEVLILKAVAAFVFGRKQTLPLSPQRKQ